MLSNAQLQFLFEFIFPFLEIENVNVEFNRLNYQYTKLEDIRANLIAEATSSARNAADQFARDSQCQVGKIKHAKQGNVSLRNIGNGFMQKASLISYLDFYMK